MNTILVICYLVYGDAKCQHFQMPSEKACWMAVESYRPGDYIGFAYCKERGR